MNNSPQLTKTRNIVPVNDNRFWFITATDYFLVSFADGQYKITEKIAFDELQHPTTKTDASVFVSSDVLLSFV